MELIFKGELQSGNVELQEAGVGEFAGTFGGNWGGNWGEVG